MPVENLDLVQTTVFVKSSKMRQLLTKKILSQNKPHTAKLCFTVVLKHFRANSMKTSLFSQKKYLRKKLRNNQRFFFLNKFEKRKS